MNREILFRGKRIDNGEWAYGLMNQYQSRLMICTEIIEHPTHADPAGTWIYNEHIVLPETVGQFTGLLDKNGTKIFEGDIDAEGRVMLWNKEYNLYALHRINGERVVITMYPLLQSDMKFFEVIGNIHEQ